MSISKVLRNKGILFISWILIFQVALSYPLLTMAANGNGSSRAAGPDARTFEGIVRASVPHNLQTGQLDETTQAVAEAVADPLVAILTRPNPELEAISHDLDVPANSPFLDQDPFFMRAQSWSSRVNLPAQPGDDQIDSDDLVQAHQQGDELLVNLPSSSLTWHIRSPLRFVFATDTYLFFAAKEDSRLFEGKTPDDSHAGEGLFFVSYSELVNASTRQEGTPVYFLPLEGRGWNGSNVAVSEIPHRDLLAMVRHDGDRTMIPLGDLEVLHHGERLHYTMAVMSQLSKQLIAGNTPRERGANALEVIKNLATAATELSSRQHAGNYQNTQAFMNRLGTANPLPAPGSTAGYGILYTGHDLSGSHLDGRASSLRKVFAQVQRALRESLGIPKAVADDATQQAIEGTFWILKIMGVITVTSAILNISLLKDRIKASGKNPFHPGSILTTTSQVLTSMFQLPYYLNGQTSSYTADRVAPSQASEHSFLRKVLNSAFIRSMKNYSSLSTHWKELLLGVFVLGNADCLAVALQGLWMNNQVWTGIGYLLPGLAARAHSAMSSPAIQDFVIQNLLNNIAVWMILGAYNVQSETITGMEVVARGLARRAMIAIGRDPGREIEDLERRVQAMLDEEKKRRGMEDPSTMWVNIDRMLRSAQAFVGYSAPAGANPEHYIGITRQGLMGPTLKAALQEAKQLAAQRPNGVAEQQAVTVLSSAVKDFSLVNRFVNYAKGKFDRTDSNVAAAVAEEPKGIKAWITYVAQRYKKIRQDLVPLTLATQVIETDANPNETKIAVPASWEQQAPQGAKLAAGLVLKNLRRFLGVKPKPAALVAAPFRNSQNPDIQVAVQQQPEATDAEQPAKIGELDPLKSEGIFARWQLRRAYRRIEGQLAALAQTRGDASKVTTEERDRIYQQEILRASGVYPDYSEKQLIEIVEGRVAAEWKERLKNPEFAAKLQSYSSADPSAIDQAFRIEQTLKADMFAQAYRSATIQENLVPAMSPAQPGSLQKLRQTKILRDNRFFTGLARIWEAQFSRDHYERGFYAKLVRQFAPVLHHSLSGYLKIWVPLATVMTTEYFVFKHLWHAAPAWSSLLIYKLIFYGPTVKGGWTTTIQIFDHLGIPIQKNWKTMLLYGLVGGLVYTWTGPIYMGLLNPEITWLKGLIEHAAPAVSHGVRQLIDTCRSALEG